MRACSQQSNGYDCGVYLLLFAEYLASQPTQSIPIDEQLDSKEWMEFTTQMNIYFTESVADTFRSKIYSEINLLSDA